MRLGGLHGGEGKGSPQTPGPPSPPLLEEAEPWPWGCSQIKVMQKRKRKCLVSIGLRKPLRTDPRHIKECRLLSVCLEYLIWSQL